MNEHCKYCDQPRKPRKDRPGKFFALCEDHYAEYQRQKNRESYTRHKEKRVQNSRNYREKNPEKALASVLRAQSTPEGKDRRRKYMWIYNSPHRAFVKDACEKCGYETRDPEYRTDLDVHHKDENKANNDSANLETLCPPCHRLLKR